MIIHADRHIELTFRADPPLFLPYCNEWGKNVYFQYRPFSHDPFTIPASSTSGSPVILSGNRFFGFLNRSGGRFAFDGATTLTVTLEPGQALFVEPDCDPYAAWAAYNREILGDAPYEPQPFWSHLEYCTWVEQSRQSALRNQTNHQVLNQDFVYDYLRRVNRMNLPRGKFTIDDGWAINTNASGGYSSGNWIIDREKFPDFERLIADIRAEGFVPGLWFAPFTATPDSTLAQAHPELLGTPFSEERRWYNLHCDEQILRPYYRELFSRFAQLGIRKLKLDISYGPKNEMIDLLVLMRQEIKIIDPTIEVETHIPDIFAAMHADTVRINDVSIDPAGEWRNVTSGHYQVCRHSAANRILNLDHIGSNLALPRAADYLAHFAMLKTYTQECGGYPVLSMLPDCFDASVTQAVCSGIRELFNEDGSRKTGI